MSWSNPGTLSTPGPSLSFNTGGIGDDNYLDPEQCDWTVDVRLETQPAPRTAGVIAFPPLRGAGHLKLAGRLKPATDTADARDAMQAVMEAAAVALETGPGTFTLAGRGSLTVTLETYPVFSGGFRKSFVWVLLAVTPTWS